MQNLNQAPSVNWAYTLEESVSRLGLKKNGAEYHGPCPNCQGKDRFWLAVHKGRITDHCRQQCDSSERLKILINLGLVTVSNPNARPAAHLNGSNWATPATADKLLPDPHASAKTEPDQQPDSETCGWASELLRASERASHDNPYLKAKDLIPANNMISTTPDEVRRIVGSGFRAINKLKGPLLGVPIFTGLGANLISYELIDEAGKKVSLPGKNTRTGTFYCPRPIRPDENRILLVEGAATALTGSMITDNPVVAALANQNLQKVADHLIEVLDQPKFVVAVEWTKTGKRDPVGVRAAKYLEASIL